MLKNTAGQAISAQMTTAADGSNFTGAVTVYVTGNAGTQTIGSVGSGICTHKGNGEHSYSPSQAETNYNNVKFTFVGTGAVTVGLMVYPRDLLLEGIHARGALSGTHNFVSADLGANAPSTDISGFVLYIPTKGFISVINSYTIGTGVVVFDTTTITLEDGDEWILLAAPKSSMGQPISADIRFINGYPVDGIGQTADKWRGA